jgi:arginine decarboxylase
MLYRNFFIVSGKGKSKTSKLNAFDAALAEAGIAQCNLVPVSSILPEGAKEINPKEIETGSITFTVLSRCDGAGGDLIATGVSWAFVRGMNTPKKYGIVAEASGDKSRETISADLDSRLLEMAETRRVIIESKGKRIEDMTVPEGFFGCVVSALIYVPE